MTHSLCRLLNRLWKERRRSKGGAIIGARPLAVGPGRIGSHHREQAAAEVGPIARPAEVRGAESTGFILCSDIDVRAVLLWLTG